MMNRELFRMSRQHIQYGLFCFAYLLGLVAAACYITRYPVSSLMRLLVYPQMSIVVGFVLSALPFIVIYIFFRCSAICLIYPVAFLRGFAFMYCFGGVSIAFMDAGWLVRCLLLFTDALSVPLLIWYVGRVFAGKEKKERQLWYCLLCVLAIRCIDCSVVSPFVSELLLF